MAKTVLMPKQGNTVESCVLLEWNKQVGDVVAVGDVLCEAETDKATIEVESTEAGVLLKTLYNVDDDVPVQTVIAVVGEAGEDVSEFENDEESGDVSPDSDVAAAAEAAPAPTAAPPATAPAGSTVGVSPRARHLAASKGVDPSGLAGSGPSGRIIERDVQSALASGQPLTPAAAALAGQGMASPGTGTGIGGRVLASDMGASSTVPAAVVTGEFPGPFTEEPVKGVRKIIAARMIESLATTAQLTNSLSADATAILGYRKKLKASGETMGLSGVSVNDLVMFLVSRVLKNHPVLNSHWLGSSIKFFDRVHLGFAVDTPKGLLVPVIKNADLLSLKEISIEAKRLAMACRDGKAGPDDLSGATFTISNLGAFGIESFTPIINPPEVGILGVCGTELKPVMVDGEVQFKPHMGLSLTYDHQAVDGVPASRFLADLKAMMENFDLVLAG